MTGPVSAGKVGFSGSSESFWVGSHWAREIMVEKDKTHSKKDKGKGESWVLGFLASGLKLGRCTLKHIYCGKKYMTSNLPS